MPRRFAPRLEGIESRLAPSTARFSTAILPYLEQDNVSKQAASAEYLGAEVKRDVSLLGTSLVYVDFHTVHANN